MKLFVPEPEIQLYTDGFEKHDKLNRKDQGVTLSNLVENISDPMVIALNGEWGSGKSVFLKCWVGEHRKLPTNQARPIYFDAFEHDFMADPLIALVSVLDEQIKKDNQLIKTSWKAAKNVAPKLARFGARTTLAAMTAGVSEITGAVGDAVIQAAKNSADNAIDQFWAGENSKRAAIQEFRNALTDMAEEQKLVIVIDELDRCRPDFALSMLEIIKHLFNVPNVHFILGVNLDALGHSVKARYGAGIDAERYLRKFFKRSLELEKNLINEQNGAKISEYFLKACEPIGAISDTRQMPRSLATTVYSILKETDFFANISLRDVNTIYSRIVVILGSNLFVSEYRNAIALMIILEITDNALYHRVLNKEDCVDDVKAHFRREFSNEDPTQVSSYESALATLYKVTSVDYKDRIPEGFWINSHDEWQLEKLKVPLTVFSPNQLLVEKE